jgi:hypothetical protein
LQHKHYPDFFSSNEIIERDILFQSTLNTATAILVNSIEAKNDINKYYPDIKTKILSMPFAPYPLNEWLKDSNKLIAQYKLPLKYFTISNQFWIHKDHATAFKALKILHDIHKQTDIHIVCTGKQEDFRFPDYFNRLIDVTM